MIILQDNTTNKIIGVYDDGEVGVIITQNQNLIYNEYDDLLPEMDTEYK